MVSTAVIINFIVYDGHLFDRIVSSVAMRNTMTEVRDTAMLRAPAPAVEQNVIGNMMMALMGQALMTHDAGNKSLHLTTCFCGI